MQTLMSPDQHFIVDMNFRGTMSKTVHLNVKDWSIALAFFTHKKFFSDVFIV